MKFVVYSNSSVARITTVDNEYKLMEMVMKEWNLTDKDEFFDHFDRTVVDDWNVAIEIKASISVC